MIPSLVLSADGHPAVCRIKSVLASAHWQYERREHSTMQRTASPTERSPVKQKKCINNTVELVSMVTDGYVVGEAMQFMGTQTPQEQPDALPDDVHKRQAYRETVIESVPDLSFHPPPMKYSLHAERAVEDCCCGEVTGEGMVECHSKGHCAGKGWCHLACIGLSRAPKGKWLSRGGSWPWRQAWAQQSHVVAGT